MCGALWRDDSKGAKEGRRGKAAYLGSRMGLKAAMCQLGLSRRAREAAVDAVGITPWVYYTRHPLVGPEAEK